MNLTPEQSAALNKVLNDPRLREIVVLAIANQAENVKQKKAAQAARSPRSTLERLKAFSGQVPTGAPVNAQKPQAELAKSPRSTLARLKAFSGQTVQASEPTKTKARPGIKTMFGFTDEDR